METIIGRQYSEIKSSIDLVHQPDFFGSPQQHYLSADRGGYFSINYRTHTDHLRQQMYPVSRMPWVLDQHARQARLYDQDFYASMATFAAKARRAALLRHVAVVWVDFDYYKIDGFGNLSPEQFMALAEIQIEDMGIPRPSFTMSSGRGAYAYWILDKALPHQALPRWQACIKTLASKLEALGADPKACLPTQIMRVNGSRNTKVPAWYPKDEQTVRVIDARTDAMGNALAYDFDFLSDHILPYTREQLSAFRHGKKVWHSYADNAKAREKYLASIRKGPIADIPPELRPIIADHDAARLWWGRVCALRSIAVQRGGIQDGEGRNEWCWILTNGIAWCSTRAALRFDAGILIREVIPTYTPAEIQRAGAAVAGRVNAGRPLYAMATQTLCTKLGITEEDLAAHWPKAPSTVNEGVMGFEPIEHLPFDQYLVETKRRQSLAAERTNEIKRGRHEQDRAAARILRAQDVTQKDIAAMLGVSQKTVSKWLSE